MNSIEVGKIVEGQITGITKYGVFVSLEDNYVGMVHISEVSNDFVSDLKELFTIGSVVKVKVLEIDENKLQVKLSIKKVLLKRKRNYKKIEENKNGFRPLKSKLNEWVEEKISEIEKK